MFLFYLPLSATDGFDTSESEVSEKKNDSLSTTIAKQK